MGSGIGSGCCVHRSDRAIEGGPALGCSVFEIIGSDGLCVQPSCAEDCTYKDQDAEANQRILRQGSPANFKGVLHGGFSLVTLRLPMKPRSRSRGAASSGEPSNSIYSSAGSIVTRFMKSQGSFSILFS